ncbi:MAG: hypothetical protein NWT08_00805 [Akkermansiaceae bacterium]|jgi:hypothetical protein|nr:hypothetical protein [Akkermansiaceae bacterium]MDP4648085.1 hypothetical protein [Akkermansiaceae bacterium]MDP4720833.1 hypothetical protein [Akkermansiaceae bacterium]MDP4780645.1 hypothetical protein [Akkermansiaceae bacterium]MDP4848473.1 hypothetical protein [Akkermansiaceae bacterium]
MKNKYQRTLIQSAVLATGLGSGIALAGPIEVEPAPEMEVATEDVVSGSLSLDFNSHFVSYGVDVWNDGDSMSDPTFNPSLELAFALPGDVTFTLGTWWDVNSKAQSTLGGRIQEIDVWAGLSKDFGPVSLGVTYQAWMYGGTTEEILDISIGYDTFLSPSLVIHNRLDSGASGGDTGTVLVLGLEHGIEAGPVSISFPFSIAYFTDEGFHGTGPIAAGGADSGIGYASFGVGFSVPLSTVVGEAYGDWDLHGGLTYYVTDRDVIPGRAKGDFLTANVGLGLSF